MNRDPKNKGWGIRKCVQFLTHPRESLIGDGASQIQVPRPTHPSSSLILPITLRFNKVFLTSVRMAGWVIPQAGFLYLFLICLHSCFGAQRQPIPVALVFQMPQGG